MKRDQPMLISAVDSSDPRIETPEAIRDLILDAMLRMPLDPSKTTDEVAYSRFIDEAFVKIGTASLANEDVRGR